MIAVLGQNDAILAATSELLSLAKTPPQDKGEIFAFYQNLAKKSALERRATILAKYGE